MIHAIIIHWIHSDYGQKRKENSRKNNEWLDDSVEVTCRMHTLLGKIIGFPLSKHDQK